MLTKLFQYSIVHSSRIESIRNRLLLQLFISEMIHAKQWHYSLQQRLPEASFHSFYMKNPRNSSSTNSTSRRQTALRVILHPEGKEIFYSVYKAFQPQDLPQAFQFYRDIPDISSHSRHSSISLIRMQILHIDWFPPETPLSANQEQYKTFYKHYILQRKGDVAISVIRHYSTE